MIPDQGTEKLLMGIMSEWAEGRAEGLLDCLQHISLTPAAAAHALLPETNSTGLSQGEAGRG